MGTKVAATCLHWSQPVVSHSPPSFSQTTLAFSCSSLSLSSSSSSSSSSSLSSNWNRSRRKRNDDGARSIVRFLRSAPNRSPLLSKRSRSCDFSSSGAQSIGRSCGAAGSDNVNFSDEEFARTLRELALRFHVEDDGDSIDSASVGADKAEEGLDLEARRDDVDLFSDPASDFGGSREGLCVEMESDAAVERKANSVDLPISLRMLKRKRKKKKKKKKLEEEEGAELALSSSTPSPSPSYYCSMKKAFSSMVFMIGELQTFTLQMREALYYQDLQGILGRVQRELHASFVWLFQQIFSRTPTLMVSVMILLANFTVYSMTNSPATAITIPPPHAATTATESVTATATVVSKNQQPKFDPLSIKSFSVASWRTASVVGNGGGGGKVRPVAGATDGGGDGWFEESAWNRQRAVVPDEQMLGVLSSVGGMTNVDSVVGEEDEVGVWNSIVEEASRMQAASASASGSLELDHETMQRFVSPITVEVEPDDYADYMRTDLQYQIALSEEPDNPLILSNYAQFLYLVVHDHDRAEEYFKRATRVEPPDADSLSRYASFLWMARNDLTAAEETYLEAIAADPSNTYYAANYAHFLWSTGGEDTCYPLDGDV